MCVSPHSVTTEERGSVWMTLAYQQWCSFLPMSRMQLTNINLKGSSGQSLVRDPCCVKAELCMGIFLLALLHLNRCEITVALYGIWEAYCVAQ